MSVYNSVPASYLNLLFRTHPGLSIITTIIWHHIGIVTTDHARGRSCDWGRRAGSRQSWGQGSHRGQTESYLHFHFIKWFDRRALCGWQVDLSFIKMNLFLYLIIINQFIFHLFHSNIDWEFIFSPPGYQCSIETQQQSPASPGSPGMQMIIYVLVVVSLMKSRRHRKFSKCYHSSLFSTKSLLLWINWFEVFTSNNLIFSLLHYPL